jgi:hypothetical protein
MLGLWKTYRGRRAAADRIVPLVEASRRRLGGIPDSVWQDPYVIGFVGMLITLIATRTASSLSSEDLAAVQAGAWADITGKSGDVLGEDICFLAASNDNRFIAGCRDAESFAVALDNASLESEQLRDQATISLAPDGSEIRSALWSRYFDAHLGEPLTALEM